MNSSVPLSPDAAQKLFDGPIAAVQDVLAADRAKVLVLRDASGSPLSSLADDLLHPVILQ